MPLATAAADTITITKLGEHIGARIEGVRLGADLTPAQVSTIHRAILEHKAVFFPNQHHLDDAAQYGFAQLLGTPTAPHPTVKSRGSKLLEVNSEYGKANSWHSDVTFVDRIPKISLLRAVTLPPYGGTTTFASTVAAYEQLPEPLRLLAENLRAIHTNTYDYAANFVERHGDADEDQVKAYRNEFVSSTFETEHPVVRVHPETGEKLLLLGHFVKSFVGLPTREFTALFNLFQDRITRLENTIRWNWAPGDIAVWDNRATQHYAVDDYDDAPRSLQRVTLAGDVPIDVHGNPSRIITGDASDYSVLDQPTALAG
ncbi:MAG: TauD/TfdA family dioxygenase [Gordonia sp. (in: high G+C Gram-positive bacteria)]